MGRGLQVHNYDPGTDVNNISVQREFSLLATFKKVFRMIARLQGLGDNEFALLFEDDIAVHIISSAQVALSLGYSLLCHGMADSNRPASVTALTRRQPAMLQQRQGPAAEGEPATRCHANGHMAPQPPGILGRINVRHAASEA